MNFIWKFIGRIHTFGHVKSLSSSMVEDFTTMILGAVGGVYVLGCVL